MFAVFLGNEEVCSATGNPSVLETLESKITYLEIYKKKKPQEFNDELCEKLIRSPGFKWSDEFQI